MIACPKHMTYGPCGGVGADGSCEVRPEPCVFLGRPVVPWAGPVPRGVEPHALLDIAARRPLVVSGMPAAPLSAASISACADRMRVGVDAVLAGDSGVSRVQFPPAYRARLMQDEGLTVWAGLNCRDRNRVALEGELAALAHAGVAAVHCVTGDHPDRGLRPDAAAVFDLEGTELVPLARAHGLLVSVAESPAAPGHRAARLAEKVRAGAQLAMLQYCGNAADVAAFAAAACAAGAEIPLLPGVPVIVDVEGAQLLASFASAVLPTGYVDGVLGARDPFTAGIEAALALARELVAVPGVAGVVLTGGVVSGAEPVLAEALGAIGRELGASSP